MTDDAYGRITRAFDPQFAGSKDDWFFFLDRLQIPARLLYKPRCYDIYSCWMADMPPPVDWRVDAPMYERWTGMHNRDHVGFRMSGLVFFLYVPLRTGCVWYGPWDPKIFKFRKMNNSSMAPFEDRLLRRIDLYKVLSLCS